MKQPHDFKVSIVVPAKNAGQTIGNCLRSLFNQTIAPSEIIVVNNDSSDATQKIVDDFKHPLLKTIYVTPPSRGKARHAGILSASGNIIVMIDADCEVEPNWLSELINPIRNGAKVVVGCTLSKSDSLISDSVQKLDNAFLQSAKGEDTLNTFTSTHFAAVCEVFEKISFRSDFVAAEDFDFWLQCLWYGIPIHYSSSAVARRYVSEHLAIHLGKSFSRGLHTYKAVKCNRFRTRNQKKMVYAQKGLFISKSLYTLVWGVQRLFIIPFQNSIERQETVLTTFYDLFWHLGVNVARGQYIFSWLMRPWRVLGFSTTHQFFDR